MSKALKNLSPIALMMLGLTTVAASYCSIAGWVRPISAKTVFIPSSVG
jgi:hypothetical protein